MTPAKSVMTTIDAHRMSKTVAFGMVPNQCCNCSRVGAAVELSGESKPSTMYLNGHGLSRLSAVTTNPSARAPRVTPRNGR